MAGGDRFPRLLVCEGDKDALFFHHFIEARKLPRFHILPAYGKDRIGLAIEGYKIDPKGNYASIGEILIVADNDDDPKQRFGSVCAQIDDVFPGTAPAAQLQKSKKSPYCTVLMLPWGEEHGTLEKLVQSAARAAADKSYGDVVDNFLAAAKADKRGSESRHAKAWLRSNLAVRCSDPFIPLGEAFKLHKGLISLGHNSLDRLAGVLASFDAKKKP